MVQNLSGVPKHMLHRGTIPITILELEVSKQARISNKLFQEKLQIIELREKGNTFAKIAKDKKMNESTVRGIYKDREKIKDYGIKTANYSAIVPVIRPRSPAKLEMEEVLFIWVEDCAKR